MLDLVAFTSGDTYSASLQIIPACTKNCVSLGLDTAAFIPNKDGVRFSANLTDPNSLGCSTVAGPQAWLTETPRKIP